MMDMLSITSRMVTGHNSCDRHDGDTHFCVCYDIFESNVTCHINVSIALHTHFHVSLLVLW